MRTTFHLGGAFRTLWTWEKPDYVAHLQRLDAHDRRMRFHRAMSDDALALHADRAFETEVHIIGWFVDGELRGAAEVAVFPGAAGPEAEAAFAVEAAYRGYGVGKELMHRAALYARNRNAANLHIATESENQPMMRLALRSGAEFTISSTDADGVLHQTPRTVYSLLLETLEEDTGFLRWCWDAALGWVKRRVYRAQRDPAADV